MREMLAIGVAGAIGAIARTVIGILVPETSGFPVGTFVVNIVGTFILCFLVERVRSWTIVNKTMYDAITIGFLGSFTTFSAFSFETLILLETDIGLAFCYISASLVVGLFSGVLGIWLGGRGQ